MSHPIVDRKVWLEERMALLRREKAVTRELDLLAIERQKLPWVEIDKHYELETPAGPSALPDLFEGRSQLIIYHFMFGAEWQIPCDGCSAWADAFNNTIDQIHSHDANLIAVSSAPVPMLVDTASSRGWSFLWASSADSDFNRDFHMSVTGGDRSKTVGDEIIAYDRGESGGINVFAKQNNTIYHTYSCHNRGIQQMNGALGYIDLLPLR